MSIFLYIIFALANSLNWQNFMSNNLFNRGSRSFDLANFFNYARKFGDYVRKCGVNQLNRLDYNRVGFWLVGV